MKGWIGIFILGGWEQLQILEGGAVVKIRAGRPEMLMWQNLIGAFLTTVLTTVSWLFQFSSFKFLPPGFWLNWIELLQLPSSKLQIGEELNSI